MLQYPGFTYLPCTLQNVRSAFRMILPHKKLLLNVSFYLHVSRFKCLLCDYNHIVDTYYWQK